MITDSNAKTLGSVAGLLGLGLLAALIVVAAHPTLTSSASTAVMTKNIAPNSHGTH